MKKSLVFLMVVALCISMIFGGCSKSFVKSITAETSEDKLLNKTVVGTIDKHKITHADYNFIYALVYNSMAKSYSNYQNWEEMEIGEGKTVSDYMRESTMEQFKLMYAAVDIAKKNGIKLNRSIKQSAAKQKNDVIKQIYTDEKGYKQFLETAHTTDAAFTNYFDMHEVYNVLFEKLTQKGGKASIDTNKLKKDFLKENEGKWRVQHILISTMDQKDEAGNVTAPAKSQEEALRISKEVIKKLNEGADFDSLIEKYNEDPGTGKGKFYLFGEGEMMPEFEEAAKNLEIGKFTQEPVKTSVGYHIIKRYDIDASGEEFKTFKNEKLQEKVIAFVNDKMKKQKVSFDDQTIDKYFKAIKDADAAAEAKYQKDNYTVNDPNATAPTEQNKSIQESNAK